MRKLIMIFLGFLLVLGVAGAGFAAASLIGLVLLLNSRRG